MVKELKRSNSTTTYRIVSKGTEYDVDKTHMNQQLQVDDIIRINNTEYDGITPDKKLFTHFNLQISNHKVGARYALPRILRHGYYNNSTQEEQLPVLSFDNCLIGECVDVKESLMYNELIEDDFMYSMSHIRSVTELKQAILKRYTQSLPHLSKEEILSLGVSMTTLRLL